MEALGSGAGLLALKVTSTTKIKNKPHCLLSIWKGGIVPKMMPLTKEGKKDWVRFFTQMSDREILLWTVTVLKKMPMSYLKAAGQRLAKIKK